MLYVLKKNKIIGVVWRHSSDISTCVWVCLICWEAVVLAGWRSAQREAQMAASSEHEFEVECPESYPKRYSCDVTCISLENPNDVTSSPKKQKSTWPRLGNDLKGLIRAALISWVRTKKDTGSPAIAFCLPLTIIYFLESSLRDALFEVTVTKPIQPLLDVPSRNAELPFSGSNSVVSSVQNNALLLFFCVLASNGLHNRLCAEVFGLLISRSLEWKTSTWTSSI